MVYEIPASKASIAQNRFKFKIPGEKKVYDLPLQQYINADLRDRLGKAAAVVMRYKDSTDEPTPEESALVQAISREVLEHYVPDLYSKLDNDQVNELAKAWGEASKVSMGESSASAGS